MAARDKKRHLDDIQEDAELNMTPMIDVVFLQIIFFLCIDFRILEAKLPAYLPPDRGGSPRTRSLESSCGSRSSWKTGAPG